MSNKCCENKDNPRLNRVGGQAVLEGVMMKAGEHTVTSCRLEDGSITVHDDKFVSVRKKHKFLNIPVLRGVINFIEMMILSFKTLNVSAEALGIEEECEKENDWVKKHFGIKLTDLIMIISVVLGLVLAVVLFKILPALISEGIALIVDEIFIVSLGVWRSVIEGVVKVGIFIFYLWAVSLLKDIHRTFMYHGAEHKSIACFEAGDELTPENAMKHKRFHPRCGTSFMFLMIAIGIFVSIIIRVLLPDLGALAYIGISLLTLPLTMGVGYEILMLAGKHDNKLTRAISAPGIWIQKITTKEPTEDMLEVAITSIKCALRDEFPEFMEFFNNREWEKKDEAPEEENAQTAETVDDETAEVTAEAGEAEAVEESSEEVSCDVAEVEAEAEESETEATEEPETAEETEAEAEDAPEAEVEAEAEEDNA